MALTKAQLTILKGEINIDPLGRGYSAMDMQAQSDDLNLAIRDNWVDLFPGDLFEAIDATEFAALSPAATVRVDRILALGSIESGIKTNPTSKSRAELISVFGGGSATITALAASANQQIGRSAELGLGSMKPQFIGRMRIEEAKGLI